MRPVKSYLVLAVGLAVVQAATAETIQLDKSKQARAGIALGAVQERTFGDQIRVVGRAVRAPEATTNVMTVLDGRVVEILVAPGDEVRVGQPLARLHSHDLHRLRGEVLERRQELRLAESSLRAGEKLLELEGISRVELERRRQIVLAARVAFDNSREELHEVGYAEAEIEQLLDLAEFRPILTVRSPTRGVVLRLEAQVHAWVMAYEPMMLIGDPQQLELELQLPPFEAGSVTEGDLVEFVPMGRRELWGLAHVVQLFHETRLVPPAFLSLRCHRVFPSAPCSQRFGPSLATYAGTMASADFSRSIPGCCHPSSPLRPDSARDLPG